MQKKEGRIIELRIVYISIRVNPERERKKSGEAVVQKLPRARYFTTQSRSCGKREDAKPSRIARSEKIGSLNFVRRARCRAPFAKSIYRRIRCTFIYLSSSSYLSCLCAPSPSYRNTLREFMISLCAVFSRLVELSPSSREKHGRGGNAVRSFARKILVYTGLASARRSAFFSGCASTFGASDFDARVQMATHR